MRRVLLLVLLAVAVLAGQQSQPPADNNVQYLAELVQEYAAENANLRFQVKKATGDFVALQKKLVAAEAELKACKEPPKPAKPSEKPPEKK